MSTDAPKWVWWVYYIISAYFILAGIFSIVSGAGLMGKEWIGSGPCDIIFGAVNLIMGIGLATRWELIRGVANVVCFLQMLDAGFGAVQGFFFAPLLGIMGPILLIMNLIQFCLAGFMIFLIGETDKYPPRS